MLPQAKSFKLIEELLMRGVLFALLVYIVLRAKLIPMTIDEVATVLNHVPRSVLDIVTYKSDATPNNHVLNTLLIKAFSWLLGDYHVVVRIPAILGGVIYGWAAYQLARLHSSLWVRWFVFLMLLANPFVLEFFALARGYSLGTGLMLAAIYVAVLYDKTHKMRDLAGAILLAILAVESNFTLLNFFVPFVFLLLLWRWSNQRSGFWPALLFSAVGTALLAGLCYWPIMAMRSTDQFRFWGGTGFYTETVVPLIKASIRNGGEFGPEIITPVIWTIVVLSVGGWATGIFRWIQQKGRMDATIWITGLFLGTVLFNLLQYYLFATPFLNPRTALFFYPLFALQAAVIAQWKWDRWGKWSLAYILPVLLAAGANFQGCVNFKTSYEWWFDSGSITVLGYLQKHYHDEHRSEPFTLDASWELTNSVMYHANYSTPHFERYVDFTGWHERRDYPKNTDFYYTSSKEEVNALANEYEMVLEVPDAITWLLRKKQRALE
jgi:hypothetical protein